MANGPGATALDTLESARREVTQDYLSRPGKDLADLSDQEFEDGLLRLKRVQERMRRILSEALIEDVHYGKEKDRSGKPVFKKNRLKKAGGEELRRLMRLTVRDTAPPQLTITPELVAVIVTCGVYDSVGRLLAEQQGACNTLEKRFKKYDGTGWVYTDPREALHDCLVMARKRAASLLTCEASGATGFFADEEAMGAAFEEEEEDEPISRWTDEEKRRVVEACQAKNIGKHAYVSLCMEVLGRTKVGSGEDVKRLLAAIEGWTRPADASPVAPPSAAAAPPSAPRAAEPSRAAAERAREELSRPPDALTRTEDDLPF